VELNYFLGALIFIIAKFRKELEEKADGKKSRNRSSAFQGSRQVFRSKNRFNAQDS